MTDNGDAPRPSQRHAPLLVAIWDDPEFCALPAGAQRLYMLLISQRKTSMVGMLPYSPRRWARLAADTTIATIDQDLTVLLERRFVLIDEHTDELLIRTRVKHDPPRGSKSIIAMWRSWETIESGRLRRAVLEAVPQHVWDDERVTTPPGATALLNTPSDAPSDGGSHACAPAHAGAPVPPFHLPPTTHHPAIAGTVVAESPIASVTTPEPTPSAAQRDDLFDALADACGMDYAEMTKRQRQACGVAKSELAKVGATASEIKRRAAIYRGKFPQAALTPNALASQWAALRNGNTTEPTLSRGMQAHLDAGRRLGIIPGGAT